MYLYIFGRVVHYNRGSKWQLAVVRYKVWIFIVNDIVRILSCNEKHYIKLRYRELMHFNVDTLIQVMTWCLT